MAQQYDGSIKINTKIEQKDFNTTLSKMKSTLSNFGSAIGTNINNFGKSFSPVIGKIKETEIEINNLTTKMANLKSQPLTNTTIENLKLSIKNTTSEIDTLKSKILELQNQTGDIKAISRYQSQIDMANQKLNELYVKQDQLLYAEAKSIAPEGVKNLNTYLDQAGKSLQKNSTEWKDVKKEITKTENQISSYKKKLTEVSKIKGVDTQEYSKTIQKLATLNSKLDTYNEKLKIAQSSEQSKVDTKYSKLAEQLEKANIKLSTYRQKLDTSTNSTLKLKNVSSGLHNTINSLNKSFNKLLSTLGIAFSVRQVINWANAWKSAYTTQLQVETQLETTMKRNVNATNEQVQAIKDLTSAQQEIGIVGDEVQIAGLQELAIYAKEKSTLQQLLPIMNDVAVQRYGFTVTTENAKAVADLFGKALAGNTSILKRNGYTLTENQEELLKYGTEAQKVAVISETIGSTVSGMNQALANTDIGKQVQLSNTLGDIKELYGNIVSKIYTLLIPALNKLADMLVIIGNTALNTLKVIYKFFGKEFDTNLGLNSMVGDIDTTTDSTEQLTDATNDLADATANVSDEVKGALSSFDELEVISLTQNTSSDTSTIDDDTTDIGNNESLSTLDSTIGNLANSTEDYTLSNSKLLDSLKKLKTQLDGLKDFSGQALMDFYEHFLKPLGSWTVNEALPRFIGALADGMSKVDWQKINDSLVKLWDALEPFAENVGDGLLWLWENVLVPFGTWVANELLPAFLDLLSTIIEDLNIVIENFKPVAQWIWDKFLEPIAKWTGGVIIAVLKSLTIVFEDLGNFMKDHPTISNWIVGITLAIAGLTKGIPLLITAFSGLNPVKVLITTICAVLLELYMLFFHYDEASEMFPAWFDFWEGVGETMYDNVQKIKETIAEFGGNILAGFKEGIVDNWNSFINWVKEKFNGFIDAVKELFGIHSPSTVFLI